MQIEYGVHIYAYTDGSNRYEDRKVWYLRDNKGNCINSFDYNIKEDKIRFYGSDKEYDPDKVPKSKLKLWNVISFRSVMKSPPRPISK